MFDDKITEFLKNGLNEGVYPGAVLLVAKGKDIVFFQNVGNRALIPKILPMKMETIFDLASLTKPLATTLAMMKLVDEGMLDLDMAISSIINPFPWKDKAGLTPRLLLTHSSGLLNWRAFYLEILEYPIEDRKKIVRGLIMKKPLHKNPGNVSLYSDLGFILLEWIIEIITGRDLSSFLDSTFYQPLELKGLYLNQTAGDNADQQYLCAATEHCQWRKKIIQGQVHDENAYSLGGYSGHAGLFGKAKDIFTLTNLLLEIYHGFHSKLLKTKTVKTFFSRQEIVPGSTWALGWDTPDERNSSSGNYFSSDTVGHTGFTGTSIWIDLEKKISVIFLTNRIHPDRSNEKIKGFRPKLHNLIMKELGYA
ncbi:MAG TPA: serine hydrolase [Desulfatiglandales bacterium]|nr:serine hydrolase [Desulfatiglandales bacterium]